MPVEGRAGFVAAMDRPIARGRFSAHALGGAAFRQWLSRQVARG